MPPNPHVLLLGGHGKISLLLTPLLLSRSWRLTSVIRDPTQGAAIQALGANQPGTLAILVASLEDIKSDGDAARILEQTKPDYVVWSAGPLTVVTTGAGGKGGPTRTNAIDRDAARHFIRAAIQHPSSSVRKFLLVSANNVRQHKAPWWSDEDWARAQRTNGEVMPTYYKAKLAADELLTVLGERRMAKEEGGEKGGFQYIILRPGTLTDGEVTGRVALGKEAGTGSVARADVAEVAARLLESEGAKGWFDLVEGEEEVGDAVARVVRDRVDCRDGESLEEMEKDIA